MFNKLFSKQIQKGLSLIEASMVLVLSAVVVAGVMAYYQIAQNNNNLDKLSAEMMHIVSEVNGLYAGAAKGNGGTDYDGLNLQSLLASIADLQEYKDGSTIAIKTPYPGIVFFAAASKQDPNNPSQVIGGTPKNLFVIAAGDTKQGIVDKTLCTKLMAINFGGQAVIYGTVNGTTVTFNTIGADRPFSERVKVCNNLKKDDHVGIWFK